MPISLDLLRKHPLRDSEDFTADRFILIMGCLELWVPGRACVYHISHRSDQIPDRGT